MKSGVVVLAPPWPRSGSGNIFAAQAAAHSRRGARVLLMLVPTGRGFAHHKTQIWRDAVASMSYAGVETVAYPRAGRGRVRAYLEWLHAGRDDTLAIMARYSVSGQLPAELCDFVASVPVHFLHVNHVFSIALAQRVAKFIHRTQGRRPHLILDTHDVQSDAIFAGRKKNPLSHQLDTHDALLRTELAAAANADTLVHVTQADHDFFAMHLPSKHHTVVLPTLDPANEAELLRHRGRGRSRGGDGTHILYIGTQHEANLVTIRWLLTEVLPLARPSVANRLRIVGAVGGLVHRREPALYERHAQLFAGEVPSIFDWYTDCKLVLAPATAGTGTSIKLIEALCIGKPVLTTTLGLRGLSAEALAGTDIEVHDGTQAFAAALTRWSVDAPSFSQANAALYDRLFSNERYFGDLGRLAYEAIRLQP
jgi:glycosyltransferase involved in cell wall biosynthesis